MKPEDVPAEPVVVARGNLGHVRLEQRVCIWVVGDEVALVREWHRPGPWGHVLVGREIAGPGGAVGAAVAAPLEVLGFAANEEREQLCDVLVPVSAGIGLLEGPLVAARRPAA